ncbi:MAG: spore cortex biosynthesis protein YabQ [Clostridia bacterium]|nr:spore cortex biosynthesis protein YabQ [Clostridia bacterium]
MEIYKLQQLWVLAVCLGAGILCGIVYDAFRAWRRCFRLSTVALAVCDVAFWIISAVIVYTTIYISNSADLRWHEFIGLVAGFVLYTVYMSRFCIKILCAIITAVHKIFAAIFKIAGIPFRFLHILLMPVQNLFAKPKTRVLYLIHTTVSKIIAKMRNTAGNICKK